MRFPDLRIWLPALTGGLLLLDDTDRRRYTAAYRQLAGTEDRIAAGRRYYNANVRSINTRVEAFPSNIIAGAFGFVIVAPEKSSLLE